MPLRLEIKKKLCTRTERVKCVDLHPTQPWVLSALYSGELIIYNWKDQLTVKTFEVCPGTVIRCAKFIPQKEWIICGLDDSTLRVFNYHTMEKIIQFEAHSDFIRYIAIHPTLPLVISVSDDTTGCLWDWSASWSRIAIFEGHSHYVMMCQWNPKDPHIFATASLDKTIKVWGIQSALGSRAGSKGSTFSPPVVQPHFNLLGHESGVNCINYATSGDKPYIASGGDDQTIRIWDYQTKQCLMVLTGHTKAIVSVVFHPSLPIIISGGEDFLLNVWHANTFRMESSLNYAMGRIWGISCDEPTNAIGLATDDGTVVLKLSSERPAASMHGGKIVLAKSTELQVLNIRTMNEPPIPDGDPICPTVKDIGSCEIFPQTISHSPNGRLIAVCGDGEYIIYTSQALRNQAYGKAADFAWSSTGDYATQNDADYILIFHKFKEHIKKKLGYTVTGIFGGRLLGIVGTQFICFYDWNQFRLIRRIDVQPQGVYWNHIGNALIIACQTSFYSLEYNQQAVSQAWANPEISCADGVEDAFELQQEIEEKLESALWVGDCFLFTTSNLRLYTFIGGLLDVLAYLESQSWLLEYFPDTNRLYLIDRQFSVIQYTLPESLLLYKTAICRRDFVAADKIFANIPENLYNPIARFLEAKGYQQKALEVTQDLDHKFELARTLGHLELCVRVIREAQTLTVCPTVSNETKSDIIKAREFSHKWKQVADLALERGHISLATACFLEAEDVEGLLLVYSSTGDKEGLTKTAHLALKLGKSNVAFMAFLLLHDVDQCIRILVATSRLGEAALFARTYAPNRVSAVVKIWKKYLKDNKLHDVADVLADPKMDPQLFASFSESLEKQERLNQTHHTSLESSSPTSSCQENTGSVLDNEDSPSRLSVYGSEKSLEIVKEQEDCDSQDEADEMIQTT